MNICSILALSLFLLVQKAFCFSHIASVGLFMGEPGSFARTTFSEMLFGHQIEIHSSQLSFFQPCIALPFSSFWDFHGMFWPLPEGPLSLEITIASRNESLSFSKGFQIQISRLYPLIHPKSVEEGLEFYNFYHKIHHERGLMFSKVSPNEETPHIFLKTMMRAGTHMLINGLEEIMREFVGSPQGKGDNQRKSHFFESGGTKGDTRSTFVIWDHKTKEIGNNSQILRYVELIRDPVETIDSLFHLYSTHSHTKKLPDDLVYWRLPIFSEFVETASKYYLGSISEILSGDEIIKYVLRYEDIIMDPIKSYTALLSFILRVPITRTRLLARIKSNFEERSLRSYYRNDSSHVNLAENWGKLMKKLESKDLMRIYHVSSEWLDLFGYQERWLEYFEFGTMNNIQLQPFGFKYEKINQKTIEHLLERKDQNYKCTLAQFDQCPLAKMDEKPPNLEVIGAKTQLEFMKKAKKQNSNINAAINQYKVLAKKEVDQAILQRKDEK